MTHKTSYTKANDRILYNWSGLHYLAAKERVVHPRSEAELASFIASASHVRVVGSALSYEPIHSLQSGRWSPSQMRNVQHITKQDPNQAVVISLQREFTGLVSLDLHARRTATFRAATTIDDVIRILAQHGAMMTACPGVIGVQALAGSIATGTHGQGIFQSDYADMVQSFRIVLANGVIRLLTPAHPNFYLYLISMGVFGIITEIEIAIRPRLLYTCSKFSCYKAQFLEQYKSWNESNEFCKVWWFPKTGVCQVWLVNPVSEGELQQYRSAVKKTSPSSSSSSTDPEPVELPSHQHEDQSQMQKTIKVYLQAMADDTKVSQQSGEPQFKTLSRFMNMTKVTGYLEQLVTKGIPVPQINCEISVPREQFQQATQALSAWHQANPGKLHYPFIYRVSGPSKALLSASHRGPVVWIGFLVYISQSGDVRDDGMKTMYQLQNVLAASCDALPHWGKHYHRHLFRLQEAYDQNHSAWQRFKHEMHEVDPKQKMLSPFLKELFYSSRRRRSSSSSASTKFKSKL
jgi:FAD/FMN-containing dehydrogenase